MSLATSRMLVGRTGAPLCPHTFPVYQELTTASPSLPETEYADLRRPFTAFNDSGVSSTFVVYSKAFCSPQNYDP